MMNTKLTCIFYGILYLFLFTPANTYGQNNKAINLTNLIEVPGNFSETLTADEVEEIYTLVYDLNPTVFITDSGLKTFGDEAPVKAEFNAGTFQELYASNTEFNAVKLLNIKIAKPADYNSLDLSRLPAFQNLKYVFIECMFDCSLTRIQNMLSNGGDVVILYLVATPE